MRTDANLKTPLFMAHGTDDNVVKFKFGELSHLALTKMGVNVEFHKIEGMDHTSDLDELNMVGEWIKERLIFRETVNEVPKGRGKV
jgi:predicted esterase